jgi:hypothetical protein
LLEHRIARLVKLTAAATAATGAVVLTLRFFKS